MSRLPLLEALAPYRLYAYGIVAAGLLGGLWWFGHSRYEAGKTNGTNAATARYDKLLDAAIIAKAEADQKARDTDKRSDEITERTRADAETTIAALTSELAAARASVRDYQRQARASRESMPALGRPAIDPHVAARLAQCDRNDEAALDLAAGAQSDAVKLLQLQNWYREQQRIHNQ